MALTGESVRVSLKKEYGGCLSRANRTDSLSSTTTASSQPSRFQTVPTSTPTGNGSLQAVLPLRPGRTAIFHPAGK